MIHDHPEQVADNPLQETEFWPAFPMADQVNGSICCYADDSTLTMTGSDHETLSINRVGPKYTFKLFFSQYIMGTPRHLN